MVRRSASSADDHRMPGGERHFIATWRGDGDASGTVQPTVAAYQGGADSVHPVGLAAVIPVADIAVTAAEYSGSVDRTGNRLACAVNSAGIGEGNDRTQQRLTGHTGPIRTFAPDEFALDQCNTQARSPGTFRGILSNRPCAEYHHVEFVVRNHS